MCLSGVWWCWDTDGKGSVREFSMGGHFEALIVGKSYKVRMGGMGSLEENGKVGKG